MRVGNLHVGQTTITLPTGTGAAFSMRPPGVICAPAMPVRVALRIGRGFSWRVTTFRFSTTTLPSWGRASMTRPCLPRSLPESICTRSPFLTFIAGMWLEHLRGQADDLHEVLLAQLARDRAEDPRTARVALIVDQDGGILVEGDQRAVVTTERLLRPHDDRLHDLAHLDCSLRCSSLHGRGDDVADPRVATLRAAGHADAEELAGSRVVGHLESRLLLDHYLAFSTISARRQFFVFESGRVSTMRTTSPIAAEFCSSCAWNLRVRRTTFL